MDRYDALLLATGIAIAITLAGTLLPALKLIGAVAGIALLAAALFGPAAPVERPVQDAAPPSAD